METNLKSIFIIIIGGIPAIGKTFLSKQIILELKDEYEIKYLNFDYEENINKDNYLQYQQMRNDYLLKAKEIFNEFNNISKQNLLIILDDNFFLKSMRKKIFNSFMDKIIELNSNNYLFYYLEIFLKPYDLNYCLKKNSLRDENNKIPDNIIINMNKIFEYNSPYINNNQVLIIDIINEESINDKLIKEIFNNKEKYVIKYHKNISLKEKIITEKNDKAKLIDEIENILRKEINIILKSNEENKKKGKEISKYKKDYMKIILNNINNFENNKINKEEENNLALINELKNAIDNGLNISQNQLELIKDDFKEYLKKNGIIINY